MVGVYCKSMSKAMTDYPIKVRFTGAARHVLADLTGDSTDNTSQLAHDTLDRQKTNVVVKSDDELEAIVYELEQLVSTIQMGHPSMDGKTLNAVNRVLGELEQ